MNIVSLSNGETGLSVRTKLNTLISAVNGFTTVSGAITLDNGFLSWSDVTNTFEPFTSKQVGLCLYTGTEDPDDTTRGNINGIIHTTGIDTQSVNTLDVIATNAVQAGSLTINGLEGASVGLFKAPTTLTGNEGAGAYYTRISRTSNSHNYNYTANFIEVLDNPTTSGTVSGKVLTATIGSTERIIMNPRVADGGSAIGYLFDTNTTLLTSGSKLLSIQNNTVERFRVTPTSTDIVAGDLVLPKTSGIGIKVDSTTPTFGWKDIIGFILPDTGGANAPTLSAFRGGLIRRFAYSANDKMDLEFHIPHDYVPGTDVFVHIHWGHNGTAISGNLVVNFTHTYAKGHNQEIFPAEKTVTITYNTTNIATTPRWIHRIDEVQLSSNGGSASLMDSSLLEPDGVIGVDMTITGIPTITGGAPNEPFIFFCDLHYQTTQLPTKQKAPNFYV